MACILIIALVLRGALTIFLYYANKASALTKNIWDDAIIKAAKSPLAALIWLVALRFSFDVIALHFYQKTHVETLMAQKIAIIFCVAWFLLKLTGFVSQNILQEARLRDENADHTTIEALSKLIRLIIVVLAALVAAQNLGFSVSGIIAAGGIGGLAIGFAAKDMLANLFGGLTIYLDRPFVVGDWIRSPDKQIEGVIEFIGWRQTRIRNFNRNPIYVPNSVFTTIVIENPSRMSHRRIEETIGLRYKDIAKVENITYQIRQMLDNNKEIDQKEVKIVNFNKFGESSLDILIDVLLIKTDSQHFNKIKQDILLEIALIIQENEAEIAFATRVLHIEDLR